MSDEHFEQVIAFAKKGVELNREVMKPGEDFQPALLFVTRDGSEGVIGIDAQFMTSNATKDVLMYDVLPEIIRKQEADAVAFIASAWVAKNAAADNINPSEHPDRIDAVMVTCVSATQAKGLYAQVTRYEDREPDLGEWVELNSNVGDFEGRVVPALRRALVPQG